MASLFDGFVIFAEMRTGSNHLEDSLNALEGVTCHGEIFNPVFVGQKDRMDLMGMDMDDRTRDPSRFLSGVLSQSAGLAGFRFFHDHEPRILDTILQDRRIAKLILTRNPLDSYVSWKIAQDTGQWRLTDARHARSGRITFDAEEFEDMLRAWSGFRQRIDHALRVTGQSAFSIRYEDINDVDVLNGAAEFLGVSDRLPSVSERFKRQNPQDLEDKVMNTDEMASALSRVDRFGLDRVLTHGYAPPAGVSRIVVHGPRRLMFIPMPGAPVTGARVWMAASRDAGDEQAMTGLSQRELRKWMRTHPGFHSFTIVRHPALRAMMSYLMLLKEDRTELRNRINTLYGVPFPTDGDPSRDDMLIYLSFLAGQLSGQTTLPKLPMWAPQSAYLQALSKVVIPHVILREGEPVPSGPLAGLDAGLSNPVIERATERLSAVHDPEIEELVTRAYRRDYLQFGFGPWRPPNA